MDNSETIRSETQEISEPSVASIPPPSNKWLKIGLLGVFGLIFAGGLVFAGYWWGKESKDLRSQISKLQLKTQVPETPVQTTAPTPKGKTPTLAELTYTYNTFSFVYPKTWRLLENTTNSEFFTQNNLGGFDHMVVLQNGDYFLLIGIDTHKTGAEVGGIFTSEVDYQGYLKNHDEISIEGKKFFLWKGDTRLSALTDPHREAGIFALASLSEYIPNKVTNEQKQTFNGFDDYIQNKGGYSYMVIKLAKSGNDITPVSIQTDIKTILESIHW